NLMSAVRLIRKALPHLRSSTAPAVLTITSYSVKQPIPNLVLSNSIRMAVIGLTKTLALELGREGIRFNSILPGWTETERVQDLMEARAHGNAPGIRERCDLPVLACSLIRHRRDVARRWWLLQGHSLSEQLAKPAGPGGAFYAMRSLR